MDNNSTRRGEKKNKKTIYESAREGEKERVKAAEVYVRFFNHCNYL